MLFYVLYLNLITKLGMSEVKQGSTRAETVYLKYMGYSGFVLWWVVMIGGAAELPERIRILFYCAFIGYPIVMIIGVMASGYWRELRGALAPKSNTTTRPKLWQVIGSALASLVVFTIATSLSDDIPIAEAAWKSIWFSLLMLGMFYFFFTPSKKKDDRTNDDTTDL